MSDDDYKNYSNRDFENFKNKVDADIGTLLDKIMEAEINNNKVWLQNQFQIVVKTVNDLINNIEVNNEIMPQEQVNEMKYVIKKYIEVIDLYIYVAKRMGVQLYLFLIDPENLDKYR